MTHEPATQTAAFYVRIPSQLRYMGVVEAAITSVCHLFEIDETTTTAVVMAAIEAVTNSIQHGYKRDPSKFVDMELKMSPAQLEVIVHDQGPGFDPGDISTDITEDVDRFLAKRGRGMFIMQTCMDRVKYEFDSNGTRCHLVKMREHSMAGGEAR
jgi:serine/threonine-protein kinase RsbW